MNWKGELGKSLRTKYRMVLVHLWVTDKCGTYFDYNIIFTSLVELWLRSFKKLIPKVCSKGDEEGCQEDDI